jgi:hypothetical protein
MNVINPGNHQPLLSIAGLRDLAPQERAAHIGDHAQAMVGRLQGIQVHSVPGSPEHQSIQQRTATLTQHYHAVQTALGNHAENQNAFDDAIRAAHDDIHDIIQVHHAPAHHAAAAPEQVHQNEDGADNNSLEVNLSDHSQGRTSSDSSSTGSFGSI